MSNQGETSSSKKRLSVILKRQIPIRFDETPRSWLGGLPMMPKGTKWPRDSHKSPLHFIAQIACADLPPSLWGGLGPRSGWLLLFAEVLKILGDEMEDDSVKVLHFEELGCEHEPPKDCSTVRHEMSDYDSYVPEYRPGVPKLWRKWPVDIVVQEYQSSDDEEEQNGPPMMSGEELYNAPMSKWGISAPTGHGRLAIDRPLTRRGAFYLIEGIIRMIDREDVERLKLYYLKPRGILLEAPEPDSGWIRRIYEKLDAEKADSEAKIEENQREIDQNQGKLGDARLNYLQEVIEGRIRYIEQLEQYRNHYNEIFKPYSGPDGEARLTAEIKKAGEEHLVWLARKCSELKQLMRRILDQDLDTALPDDEWRAIVATVEGGKHTYWRYLYRFSPVRFLEKIEEGLNISAFESLEMAVREDVLDLYTRSSDAQALLPREQFDDIEQRMRRITAEFDLLHRMGDLPNMVQYFYHDEEESQLLFQIASDEVMGWMWGDLGALYVTISSENLRLNSFRHIEASLECH